MTVVAIIAQEANLAITLETAVAVVVDDDVTFWDFRIRDDRFILSFLSLSWLEDDDDLESHNVVFVMSRGLIEETRLFKFGLENIRLSWVERLIGFDAIRKLLIELQNEESGEEVWIVKKGTMINKKN
jgi:hypothetical protein